MKNIFIILLSLYFIDLAGQTIAQAEYFVDDDPGFGMATQIMLPVTNALDTNIVIDLSNIPVGYHTLYVRLKDSDNQWSVVKENKFYKYWKGTNDGNSEIEKLEYFIDDDPGFGQGVDVPIVIDTVIDTIFHTDISNLTPGLHKLYVRAQDQANNWNVLEVKKFYKTWIGVGADVTDIVQLEYFFDEDPGFGMANQVSFTTGDTIEQNFTVDISPLDIGLHKFYCRARDSLGRWSKMEAENFYKIFDYSGTDPGNNIVKFEYFIDNDPGFGNGLSFDVLPPEQMKDSTITVSLANLNQGNHQFYVRAMDVRGQWSSVVSMPFIFSHCYDGIKNEDEEYVDCGGVDCIPCTDCSHVDVTISDQPVADQTYIRASNSVTSDGLVTGNTLVIMQAENTVLLKSGFKVLNSGHFIGNIAPCNE